MSGDARDGRDPFSRYRAELEAVGFKPSSARGQNFLLDASLHRWIADRAGPTGDDTVIEIGVGLGFLTRELAPRAGHLLAVEIDERLLAIARRELADQPSVEWLHADALGGPGRTLQPRIAELAASRPGRLMVVANLPYSVSGPLVAELMQVPRLADRIVVLVQKEMAQRLVAPCGDAAYGGLSGLVQTMYAARSLRDVGPGVFRPRPKVGSAIVALDVHAELPVELGPEAARGRFARFVRQLFQQRRKALRTTFAAAAKVLGRAGAEVPAAWAGHRAEQLEPPQLLALWRACEASPPA